MALETHDDILIPKLVRGSQQARDGCTSSVDHPAMVREVYLKDLPIYLLRIKYTNIQSRIRLPSLANS